MKTKPSRPPDTPGKIRPPEFPVEARPVTAADLDGLRDMLSRLSPEAVYQRFHVPLAEVPERILRRLADKNDPGESRVVAISDGRVVGHAMYSTVEAGEAEVGVVVEDVWQSKGVGKLLLRRLATEARHEGIEVFTCSSLWENRRVAALIKTLCPAATFEVRDGRRTVCAPIREPGPHTEERTSG